MRQEEVGPLRAGQVGLAVLNKDPGDCPHSPA